MLAGVAGLFGFNRKGTAAIPLAAFPSAPLIEPPSSREAKILAFDTLCWALVGGLMFLIVVNGSLIAWGLTSRLDVIPYVADGGVFGCQPRALEAGT